MRRLDRYVLKEMVVPFITGTFIVALLFQANAYIAIAKNLNLENVPVLARVQWLVYTLPSELKLTLPTGMALAAALALGRMGRESEVTALRAAGAPVRRLMVPVVLFGLMAGCLNFYIVDQLIPKCAKRATELEAKNALFGVTPSEKSFKSNAFLSLGKYSASLGPIQRLKGDKLMISDVLLIEHVGGEVASIFVGPRGTYDAGVWTFPNGYMYAVEGTTINAVEGKSITIDQSADLNAVFASGTLGILPNDEDMPTKDLVAAIRTAKQLHSSSRRYEVEYYSRYAALFACAVFAFTSAVFAIAFSRSGGFAGLLVSFSVVVLYYNAYVISVQVLGRQENVPTWVAAWLPNILFGALGMLWVRRLE